MANRRNKKLFQKIVPGWLKYALVLLSSALVIITALIAIPKKEQEPKPDAISKYFSVVLDSTYTTAENYSWEDLYSLLALITQTTPVDGEKTPVFAMVSVPKSNAPLLLVGKSDYDGNADLEIYVFSEQKIYQLLKTKGNFAIDLKEGLLYDRNADKIYSYEPHNLLETDGALIDKSAFHFEPIPYTNLTEEENAITVENIRDYVLSEEKEDVHEP